MFSSLPGPGIAGLPQIDLWVWPLTSDNAPNGGPSSSDWARKTGTVSAHALLVAGDPGVALAGHSTRRATSTGGAWEVFTVTFNDGVTPWVLTSDDAVFAAQQTGDVTVTRNAPADFRCPVTA
jgi:hypothetical protein